MWDFWRQTSRGHLGRPESSGSVTEPQTRVQNARQEFQKLVSKVISFKDLRISLEETSSQSDDHPPRMNGSSSYSYPTQISLRRANSTKVAVEKNKLVIIMVGLPGRGKTFLCNKLKCYLNWWVTATSHRTFLADCV